MSILNSQKFEKVLRIILPTLTFLSILLLWELYINIANVSQIVLVPPSEIMPVIIEDADIFLKDLWFTYVEILSGWFVGNIVGLFMAMSLYRFETVSSIAKSFGVLVNAVPLIALAAILGGILGTDQFGKSVIVSILCFFPMFITSLKAFTQTDIGEDALFKIYAANQTQKFLKLIFPSSLPMIFTTLKINVITAIFAAVVGEFFGAHGGIGDLILSKKGLYDLPMVWAAIFYLLIASLLFYSLVHLSQVILVKWER